MVAWTKEKRSSENRFEDVEDELGPGGRSAPSPPKSEFPTVSPSPERKGAREVFGNALRN